MTMRPPRLDLPRVVRQSVFQFSRNGQYHSFHTASVLRLPNPYSKRPAELPQPADNPPRPPRVHPEHGLYGFFRNKTSVIPPATLENHGMCRPWTAEELRRKSFEDLHTLWYKCIMERNIIATEARDARRQGIFFALEGIHRQRDPAVKRTMQRIKFVLWERYRAWWGAHQLNEQDPLLLDRIKAEEMFKRQDALQEERSKMSKTKLKKLERKKDIQFKKRQTKRDKLKVEEREKEMQEAKDTEAMEEFQRLAAGGGPEAKTS